MEARLIKNVAKRYFIKNQRFLVEFLRGLPSGAGYATRR